jgi:uncharacterized protein (TIGR02391 family)
MPKSKLSVAQMRAGIPKLKKRMGELAAIDVQALSNPDDPALHSIEKKLHDTISELYSGSSDWQQFRPRALIDARFRMGYETSALKMRQSLRDGIAREIANIETIIELFNEKLADGHDSPAERVQRAFDGLALHADIDRHCTKLFEDGHYAQAVENACKVLEMLVKMRSLKDDASGTDLMQSVFSPKKAVLKFNEQSNDSERSEQQGMMFLYAGAIAALRNPRAHGLVEDYPDQAVEYLMFINMLAKALDRTSLAENPEKP